MLASRENPYFQWDRETKPLSSRLSAEWFMRAEALISAVISEECPLPPLLPGGKLDKFIIEVFDRDIYNTLFDASPEGAGTENAKAKAALFFAAIYLRGISDDARKQLAMAEWRDENPEQHRCMIENVSSIRKLILDHNITKLSMLHRPGLDPSFQYDEHFFSLLTSCTKVNTLRIGGIYSVNMQNLLDLLETNKTITALDLHSNTRCGEVFNDMIGKMLRSNTAITSLNLANCNITNPGIASSVADALRSNATLTSLNLSENGIDREGITHLAQMLTVNKTLTSLILCRNWIRDKAGKKLADALKTNTALTLLDLSDNMIGNIACYHFAAALRTNKTLTSLILTRNFITDRAATYLAETLMTNKTLTTLDISSDDYIDFYPESPKNIAIALTSNETLTSLTLSVGRGSNGALAIAEMLGSNKTLTSLELTGTDILDAGAIAFANILCSNTTLTSLELPGGFNHAGARAIMDMLKTNTTLTELYFYGFNEEQDRVDFARMLRSNTTLTKLRITNKQLKTNAVATAFEETLRFNTTLTELMPYLSHTEELNSFFENELGYDIHYNYPLKMTLENIKSYFERNKKIALTLRVASDARISAGEFYNIFTEHARAVPMASTASEIADISEGRLTAATVAAEEASYSLLYAERYTDKESDVFRELEAKCALAKEAAATADVMSRDACNDAITAAKRTASLGEKMAETYDESITMLNHAIDQISEILSVMEAHGILADNISFDKLSNELYCCVRDKIEIHRMMGDLNVSAMPALFGNKLRENLKKYSRTALFEIFNSFYMPIREQPNAFIDALAVLKQPDGSYFTDFSGMDCQYTFDFLLLCATSAGDSAEERSIEDFSSTGLDIARRNQLMQAVINQSRQTIPPISRHHATHFGAEAGAPSKMRKVDPDPSKAFRL